MYESKRRTFMIVGQFENKADLADYLSIFLTGIGAGVWAGESYGSKKRVVFSVTLGMDCSLFVVVGL